jgi:phage shock protein C
MTTTPPPAAPYVAPRRLVRRSDDRMLAGVCSGIAEYTGMDVTLVRVLTVLATVLGFGSVLVAYVVAWLLVPLDSTPTRP